MGTHINVGTHGAMECGNLQLNCPWANTCLNICADEIYLAGLIGLLPVPSCN
jgi:hypothetical protein